MPKRSETSPSKVVEMLFPIELHNTHLVEEYKQYMFDSVLQLQ